jgi:N-acyl-D-aspartate/D-glutamate deacylase
MQLYLINCSVIDCAGDEASPYKATVAITEGKIAAIDRSGSSIRGKYH